ncbi:MAG: multidrug effflux MFS transporter [Bacteroidales bacterium]|nr:multidrug effflux MFS transporter [Bacteroidales bacterium]
MKFTKKEIVIIVIITLLTVLEALSIDLYLPAFKSIADFFETEQGKVQITVSIFLAGFAVGQLLWGPLSDRFGRKIPILISMLIYTLVSFLVVRATTIEQVWVYRFLQAFSGSAGVVISRAVVTDVFDRKRTTSVFTILAVAYGVAPILAPSIGNLLVKYGNWQNTFIVMGVMGAAIIPMVLFGLPETRSKENITKKKPMHERTVLGSYLHVVRNRQFLVYTLIGAMVYCGLLTYISNSPFLLMEKGGFSGTQYGIIYAVNAIGMMIATYSINFFMKRITVAQIVKYASLAVLIVSIALGIAIWADMSNTVILVLLFLYMMPIGMIFPTTTDLALEPFHNDSGTASAIFGFTQLALTFVVSGIVGLVQNNSAMPMSVALIVCALIGYIYSVTYKKEV